ncbi:hypothetical protein AZ15_1532, partial [Bordetella bronchiseptica A1-7]
MEPVSMRTSSSIALHDPAELSGAALALAEQLAAG